MDRGPIQEDVCRLLDVGGNTAAAAIHDGCAPRVGIEAQRLAIFGTGREVSRDVPRAADGRRGLSCVGELGLGGRHVGDDGAAVA